MAAVHGHQRIISIWPCMAGNKVPRWLLLRPDPGNARSSRAGDRSGAEQSGSAARRNSPGLARRERPGRPGRQDAIGGGVASTVRGVLPAPGTHMGWAHARHSPISPRPRADQNRWPWLILVSLLFLEFYVGHHSSYYSYVLSGSKTSQDSPSGILYGPDRIRRSLSIHRARNQTPTTV
jgi:hypothetical protein